MGGCKCKSFLPLCTLHVDFIRLSSSSDGRVINDIEESELLQQADIIMAKGLTNIAIIGICASSIIVILSLLWC